MSIPSVASTDSFDETDRRSSAHSAQTTSSVAASLFPTAPPEFTPDQQTALITKYNTTSIEAATRTEYDRAIHTWIRAIQANPKSQFATHIDTWAEQIYNKNPIRHHISNIRLRRTIYTPNSLANLLLIASSIVHYLAITCACLFVIARHMPSVLPVVIRPESPAPANPTLLDYAYTYTLGLVVDFSHKTVQVGFDIGYSIVAAIFLWVIGTWAGSSLQKYSEFIRRKHTLDRLEGKFLAEFRTTITSQLRTHLTVPLLETYRGLLLLGPVQRAEMLATYGRSDEHLDTLHTFILNQLSTVALSPTMETLCISQMNADMFRELVALSTNDYIDSYAKFYATLQDVGQTQVSAVNAGAYESMKALLRFSVNTALHGPTAATLHAVGQTLMPQSQPQAQAQARPTPTS